MTEALLRREIEQAIDRLPGAQLSSGADFVAFLNRPTLLHRMEEAERDLMANKGVHWRTVRDDV